MAELKPTTIKEALAKWQAENNEPLTQATCVELQFQWPPIAKMDNSLSVLTKCEKLSLSSNMIEKINGLAALTNLKVLSLGRNNIKTFVGIEPLADTLEELWISYNNIEKMNGILNMNALKVLHMSNNNIKEWEEVQKLADMENLQDLVLVGNPLTETMEEAAFRTECMRRLPKLSLLDTIPCIRDF